MRIVIWGYNLVEMIGGLSAAEVLSGGYQCAPRGGCCRVLVDAPLKSAAIQRSCGPLENEIKPELSVPTAAGALLGIQNEPVTCIRILM